MADDSGVYIENRKMIFKNAIDFLISPSKYTLKIIANGTPNVSNIHILQPLSVTNTITNMLGGAQGQILQILGDGVCVIKNNSNIKTNTSADKLLGIDKVYTFTCINEIWYENA